MRRWCWWPRHLRSRLAHVDLGLESARMGAFDGELVTEFLRALAANGGICLHARRLAGANGHHIAEATFKGLGLALRDAVAIDPRRPECPRPRAPCCDLTSRGSPSSTTAWATCAACRRPQARRRRRHIAASPDEVGDADGLVLPGVGAFGDAMDNLRATRLRPPCCETRSTRHAATWHLCRPAGALR